MASRSAGALGAGGSVRLDGLLRQPPALRSSAARRSIGDPIAGIGHLFAHLGRAGIPVRRFPEQPSWLRWGLPRDDDELRRLSAALAIRK